MSKPVSAIVLCQHVRCLRCDYRWRDSSLIYRSASGGFSYSVNEVDRTWRKDEGEEGILNGTVPIAGIRMTKRAVAACHNCVKEPKVTLWEGRLKFEFEEPTQAPSSRSRRKNSKPIATEKMSDLLGDLE